MVVRLVMLVLVHTLTMMFDYGRNICRINAIMHYQKLNLYNEPNQRLLASGIVSPKAVAHTATMIPMHLLRN